MKKLTFEDFNQSYEDITTQVLVKAETATIVAGGQPARLPGIQAFVAHHLGLTGEDAELAVKRIMKEEIGEKPVPEAEGELQEKLTYGVNVIRRTEIGPYLGNWMIHACMKQAASRTGIYMTMRDT